MTSNGTEQPIERKRKVVAEQVKLPGMAEAIFQAFLHTDHRRGLRLIANRKDISVGEAERVVQTGLREMIAKGAELPTFRDGFGKPVRRGMGKATVVRMPVRAQGVAA